jgi:prepilin-type N-terminal cleavage/methylation domain-containing protein
MLTRARALLRDEDGFSLMELLVALAIGSVVLTAVMNVFLNGMQGSAKVADRSDASARARLTTDTISSLLQAAVCNNNTAPITAATAVSITFTGALGGPEDAAVQYRIRWDSSTKTVYEDIYNNSGQKSATDSTLLYPTTPTTTRVIGLNMMPSDGTTLFRYYPFNSTTGVIGSEVTAPGTDPAALKPIVAIATNLRALPERTKNTATASSAPIEAQSVVGQVDPSNPGQGTQC